VLWRFRVWRGGAPPPLSSADLASAPCINYKAARPFSFCRLSPLEALPAFCFACRARLFPPRNRLGPFLAPVPPLLPAAAMITSVKATSMTTPGYRRSYFDPHLPRQAGYQNDVDDIPDHSRRWLLARALALLTISHECQDCCPTAVCSSHSSSDRAVSIGS
jgi:hypothetical protein